MPVRAGTRVGVVGVAGGVGTSTVAALLGWAFAAHRPGGSADAGRGGGPLPGGPDLSLRDLGVHDLGVHDLGPNAPSADVLVLVCGAHAPGLAAARDALRGRPAVVVPVAVAGRTEPGARLVAHAAALGWDAVVIPIGRSRALAAGCALPGPELAPGPYRAAVAVAVEVVRFARGPAGRSCEREPDRTAARDPGSGRTQFGGFGAGCG